MSSRTSEKRARAKGFVLLTFVVASLAFVPDSKGKQNLKIDGRIGLGAETNAEERVDDLFEMRLGVKTKRKDGYRADVEIRADEGSRDIRVNDAYMDYRNDTKTIRVRAGRGKKILGWEYEYPTANRPGIHRSAAYQYLEDRSIVGRDYFVAAYYLVLDPSRATAKSDADATGEGAGEEDETREFGLDTSNANPNDLIEPEQIWKLGLAAHYDESKNSAFIAHAIRTFGTDWRLGAWFSLNWNRTQHSRLDTAEGALSGLYQSGPHRAELEFFGGEDPQRSLIDQYYGGGRAIRFVAGKAYYGFYFDGWNPYFIGTVIWRDLAHRGDRTEEKVLGLRRYLHEDFSIAAEIRRTRSVSDFDATTMPYERETVGFIGRYFF